MKATISRIERHIITDLEGYTIYHLCYWSILYSTGTIKTVRGYSSEALSATQRKFFDSHLLKWTSQPEPFCESGWERIRSYY